MRNTRGRKKEKMYSVAINSAIQYLFKTYDVAGDNITYPGVNEAFLTDTLGWKEYNTEGVNVTNAQVYVLGVNTPKPTRVSVRIEAPTDKSVKHWSAFVAFDKENLAFRHKLISVSKVGRMSSIVEPGQARTKVVAVDFDGILYGWRMDKSDAEEYAETLGLITSDTLTSKEELKRLVFGASRPKPPKVAKVASKVSSDNDSMRYTGGTFSSFCDDSKLDDLASSKYWRVIDKGIRLNQVQK